MVTFSRLRLQRELRPIQFCSNFKENLMSLRRVVLALAVLSLFVGVVSAQIIPVGALNCAVSASAPSLRAESKTELTGDLLIQCSGGNSPSIPTNPVPGVDITVSY